MPHVRVGDVNLYYELLDCTEPWKSGRPPLVLLHGLGGDHRMWFYQVPAFALHFPIIRLDLRGHGQSSRCERDFTIAEAATDVARLLRNLGVERAHLMGLSLGGMVALQFALDYPYATADLVLLDTLAGIPEGFEEPARQALRFIEDNDMAAVAQARITSAFSEHVDPVMRDYFIDQVARNDKASYTHAARAAFAFALGPRLREIAAPTLVVTGDEDRVVPPSLAEDLAAQIAGARLARIPRAGHISSIENAAAVNRAVLDFLLRT